MASIGDIYEALCIYHFLHECCEFLTLAFAWCRAGPRPREYLNKPCYYLKDIDMPNRRLYM